MVYQPPPDAPPPGEHQAIYEQARFMANLSREAEQRVQEQAAEDSAVQERGVEDTKRSLSDLIRLLAKLPPETATSVYSQVFPAPLHTTRITIVAGDATSEELKEWADVRDLERRCAFHSFRAQVEVLSAEQLSQRVREVEVAAQQRAPERFQEDRDEHWKTFALGHFLSDHPWTVVITKPAEWVLSAAFGHIGVLVLGRLYDMRRRARQRRAADRERMRADELQHPAVSEAMRWLSQGEGRQWVMPPRPSRMKRLVAWLGRLLRRSPKSKASRISEPVPGGRRGSVPAYRYASIQMEQFGDVLVIDLRTALVFRLDPELPVPEDAYLRVSEVRPGEIGGLRALAYNPDRGRWVPPN